ncbi:cysteine--tRNA ligase [Candidatus Micrarchaeota archaeon]|nr:cysteine--tRNA ligase [Candidatus Micrarchaeota archaeon]
MLKLFDTLSGRKRGFRPLGGRFVRIYTCGPSVYSYSHIGNFRTYLFEDVLVRYLRYKGYRVKRVMNITDVEDKAIAAARREGVSLMALEADKIRAFWRDFDSLGMVRPDVVAKASEHVPQMIGLICRLCRKGYCIRRKDGVYFNVRRFSRYGSLRHLGGGRYLGIARNEDYSREGAWDFRLWKKWTRGDGETGWDSPFGFGRPGWHIECSAMSMHYLGERFDIHCGGADNIFPHHENEIAQSEGATGKKLANFWLHSRHLTLGKKKMSKRTGNVLYVKDLLGAGAHPGCIRFYLLSKRYRTRLDFSQAQFERRVCACERTGTILGQLRKIGDSGGNGMAGSKIAGRLLSAFGKAMDDDLDTGRAFRAIFSAFARIEAMIRKDKLSREDAKAILSAMGRIDSVLGVFGGA